MDLIGSERIGRSGPPSKILQKILQKCPPSMSLQFFLYNFTYDINYNQISKLQVTPSQKLSQVADSQSKHCAIQIFCVCLFVCLIAFF